MGSYLRCNHLLVDHIIITVIITVIDSIMFDIFFRCRVMNSDVIRFYHDSEGVSV